MPTRQSNLGDWSWVRDGKHYIYRSGSCAAYEAWRTTQLVEMANVLNTTIQDRRDEAIIAIETRCVDALPSHQQMSRKRAARNRAAYKGIDPLASRESGWVLEKAKRRQAAREAKRAAARLRRVSGAFLPCYRQAGFRQAKTSAWVDDAGHETLVEVSDCALCLSNVEVVWDNKGKGRSGRFSTHTFHVPARWESRVAKRGIALIDGMLTLDARPVPAAQKRQHGVSDAYHATWVRQGKGCYLVQHSGVIMRLSASDPWVHGPDLQSAVKTASRRGKQDRRAARQQVREQAIANADWGAVWPDQDLEHVMVCLRDSESVGNCGTGTRAWVDRWLPEFSGVDCAPAPVVLAAAARDHSSTRRQAVAAVHRAVLRSRKGKAA
jgi:hypothetical protein